jgi:hypothetical protein
MGVMRFHRPYFSRIEFRNAPKWITDNQYCNIVRFCCGEDCVCFRFDSLAVGILYRTAIIFFLRSTNWELTAATLQSPPCLLNSTANNLLRHSQVSLLLLQEWMCRPPKTPGCRFQWLPCPSPSRLGDRPVQGRSDTAPSCALYALYAIIFSGNIT